MRRELLSAIPADRVSVIGTIDVGAVTTERLVGETPDSTPGIVSRVLGTIDDFGNGIVPGVLCLLGNVTVNTSDGGTAAAVGR